MSRSFPEKAGDLLEYGKFMSYHRNFGRGMRMRGGR
jgi:hypothetical protein